MSFFGVTIERIDRVCSIPGADRIEIASLAGMDFQFVVPKGRYGAGDQVLYIPADSILPNDLIEKLGLTGKLSGKHKNRVKTVVLRGEISQGLVADTDLVPRGMLDSSPDEITKYLGVTKWDPPENIVSYAKLLPIPDGIGKYDIESADRYIDAARLLMDQPVLITEKLEGQNFSVMAKPDDTIMVNMRNNTIIEIEGIENTFWKIARNEGIIDFAKALCSKHGQNVIMYGEAIGHGIKGNIYGRKNQKAPIFDIRVAHKWMPPGEYLAECCRAGIETVPVLSRQEVLQEWLDGRTIKQSSNGQSQLEDCKREGIVIRPLEEQYLPGFGRLILKQRSPEYLAKSRA